MRYETEHLRRAADGDEAWDALRSASWDLVVLDWWLPKQDGLAFALLGTVLMFASRQGSLGEGMGALQWTRFMQVAPKLHPFTLRLGVVFALHSCNLEHY